MVLNNIVQETGKTGMVGIARDDDRLLIYRLRICGSYP